MMNPEELRTLSILTQVEANKEVTQRSLAQTLGVGLGLSNQLVKMLIRKGWVKARHVRRQKHYYFLTPAGVAQKVRLGMRFASFAMRLVRSTRATTVEAFRRLKAEGVRRIVFCGAGDIAEVAYLALEETALELLAVVDTDASRVGTRFLGHTVRPLAELPQLDYDRVAVTSLEPDWNAIMQAAGGPDRVVNLADWEVSPS